MDSHLCVGMGDSGACRVRKRGPLAQCAAGGATKHPEKIRTRTHACTRTTHIHTRTYL